MARFMLMMNGKEINSIEELKANFNIKQLLTNYKAKGLQYWLEEKGYSAELNKIESIQSQDDELTMIRQMMEIFSFSKEQIEATTMQLGKKDDFDIPQCHWGMLRLIFPEEGFITKIDPIEHNETRQITIPKSSDLSIHLYGLFYYDSYFWAWCGDTNLFVGESFHAIKSKDFFRWEIDDNLSQTNIKWMHFFPGEKCCYLTPRRYSPILPVEDANPYYVKGEYQTWEKEKFGIDNQIPCRDYGISTILASKECTGILCTGSEKLRLGGLFSKPINVPKSWFFLKKGSDEFEKCSDYCVANTKFSFVFKNKFFVVSSDDNRGIYIADMINCKFSLSKCSFIPKGEEGTFSFPDILFMLDNHNELYYSFDGEKWDRSTVDAKVKKIINIDGKYFAFTENGRNSLRIFFSNDGQKWFFWYELSLDDNDWIGDIHVVAGGHIFIVNFQSEDLDSAPMLMSHQTGGYLICDLKP